MVRTRNSAKKRKGSDVEQTAMLAEKLERVNRNESEAGYAFRSKTWYGILAQTSEHILSFAKKQIVGRNQIG